MDYVYINMSNDKQCPLGRLVNIKLIKSRIKHLIVPMIYSFYKYLLSIYDRPGITVKP